MSVNSIDLSEYHNNDPFDSANPKNLAFHVCGNITKIRTFIFNIFVTLSI
jgi:hypothetical protein